MTLAIFFGNALTAFSPVLAMFTLTICRDSVKSIMVVIGAAAWMCSLFAASIVRFVTPYKKEMALFHITTFAVFQEFSRYLTYRAIRILVTILDDAVKKVPSVASKVVLPDIREIGYATGLGYGAMSAAFTYSDILMATKGPGTYGFDDDAKSEYFTLFSAFETACLSVCHVAWAVILFVAIHDTDYKRVGFVVVAHLALGYSTFAGFPYDVTIVLTGVILLGSLCVAFDSAGGSRANLKKASSVDFNIPTDGII